MKGILLAAVLVVAGCATAVMQGLVGKPLDEVIAKYGPPANSFDAGSKGTAYQWQLGYSPTGSKCFYTLYAQRGPDQKMTITAYEQPRGLCE
ncbi:hypothetical protein [Paracoccus fontiphilus]|uniref:SmpA / OmlA family protein n=1 Tax=Paracoccus fontiphilus TaxID=1815556 RepID=A0ABV7IIM4_9RHOB|nr:hypothetical protein [Paracoccus fontiphilus]